MTISKYVPTLPFKKIIRDPIHGYIQLTELEQKLLQLPALNRLHNIRMGLGYLVWPGAKACRFEHSLGVMHIADRMIESILRNTPQDVISDLFVKTFEDIFKDLLKDADRLKRLGLSEVPELAALQILRQVVRLAGLLHDVGHGPFSHISESIMFDSLKSNERKEGCKLFNCDSEKLPTHEYFSYKMIQDRRSNIRQQIEEYLGKRGPDIVAELLTKESRGQTIEILRKVISSQLDADRMDYLLRDSYVAGITIGMTDIDRIIMNLRIVELSDSYILAVHERALASIEDLMDARFKMYKWIYHHHLRVAYDALMREAIKHLVKSGYMEKDDFHWIAFLNGRTDDSDVLYCLKKYISSGKDDARLYKGLFDRRYAPLSLLKRRADYKRWRNDIRRAINVDIRDEDIPGVIIKWVSQTSDIAHDDRNWLVKETNNPALRDIRLIVASPIYVPYKWVTRDDMIFIYSERVGLQELMAASDYVNAINTVWEEYAPVFVAVVHTDIPKEELKKYRNSIYQALTRTVARHF